MKQFSISIAILFSFLGCSSLNIATLKDNQTSEMPAGTGILALVTNTIEPINHISVVGPKNFVIKWPKIGETVNLYVLPEGEYCLQKMTIGRYKVIFRSGEYDTRGVCVTVEADTLNYSGHIYLRAETITQFRYPQFIRQMSRLYPETCKTYIGNDCV